MNRHTSTELTSILGVARMMNLMSSSVPPYADRYTSHSSISRCLREMHMSDTSSTTIPEKSVAVPADGHHVGDEDLGVVHGARLAARVVAVASVHHLVWHAQQACRVLGKLVLTKTHKEVKTQERLLGKALFFFTCSLDTSMMLSSFCWGSMVVCFGSVYTTGLCSTLLDPTTFSVTASRVYALASTCMYAISVTKREKSILTLSTTHLAGQVGVCLHAHPLLGCPPLAVDNGHTLRDVVHVLGRAVAADHLGLPQRSVSEYGNT